MHQSQCNYTTQAMSWMLLLVTMYVLHWGNSYFLLEWKCSCTIATFAVNVKLSLTTALKKIAATHTHTRTHSHTHTHTQSSLCNCQYNLQITVCGIGCHISLPVFEGKNNSLCICLGDVSSSFETARCETDRCELSMVGFLGKLEKRKEQEYQRWTTIRRVGM